MGCAGQRAASSLAANGPRHDVCVTSSSPILTSEDFAAFFSVWIVRVCSDMGLTTVPGRTQLGSKELKPGSREWKALQRAVMTSRVLVVVLNICPEGAFPPPGYMAEVAWAHQEGIPVVPFVDADRYKWREVIGWRAELPDFFRSGVGPVRYHRAAHEKAKEQLTDALRLTLVESAQAHEERTLQAPGNGGKTAKAAGGVQEEAVDQQRPFARARKELELELSRKERTLLSFAPEPDPEKRANKTMGAISADEAWAELRDERIGVDRSDFERAGLVAAKLERTNSLQDINVETALTLLAKRAATAAGKAVRGTDALAAREGGVRLRFLPGADAELLGVEPAHRVVAPTRGILKKGGKKKEISSMPVRTTPAAPVVKQLRLAPVEDRTDRRFRFAVQQLEKHLAELAAQDVHELTTVIRTLRDGAEEESLVARALLLLRTFLVVHPSLHGRAMKQGCVTAIVLAMKQHDSNVDILVNAYWALSCVLKEFGKLSETGISAGNNAEAGVTSAAEGPTTPGRLPGRGDEDGGNATSSDDPVALVTKDGGLEVVVGGMRRFPACESLQERGCRCLALLAKGSGINKVSADYRRGKKVESNVVLRGQARRLIARHGGVPLLIEAMRRYSGNVEVQAAGCMAIGQLGSSEIRVKRKAAEGGVIGLVLRAMVKHQKEPDVQQAACGALRQLASNAPKNKDFIAERGGVGRLFDAARRFLTTVHWRVTSEAFGALCHLASKHPENKQRIFDTDALDLALQALAAKPEPEAAMAMSCLGLLHNLACDDAIKRHIVKLGGREAAERLEKHGTSAVRKLSRILGRTLAPPAEATGDLFGSIFATRLPGSAARRATSKRDRKKALNAMKAVDGELFDDLEAEDDIAGGEQRERSRKRRPKGATNGAREADGQANDDIDDAASEAASDVSAASSAASAASSYSVGGTQRRPGQRRQQKVRRFAKSWDGGDDNNEDVGGEILPPVDWDFLNATGPSARRGGSDKDDDELRSNYSWAPSEASSVASQLSIEATECLARGDLAGAIAKEFRIRSDYDENPAERRQRMKGRRGAGDGSRPGSTSPRSTGSFSSRGSRASGPAKVAGDAASAGGDAAGAALRSAGSFSDRLGRALGGLEQEATRRMDKAGQSLRGAMNRV